MVENKEYKRVVVEVCPPQITSLAPFFRFFLRIIPRDVNVFEVEAVSFSFFCPRLLAFLTRI